ncbi:MAG: hypothetical protein GX576_01410 [Thauera phenolivorans]|uniref:Glutaredoxin n=1 Tax=Thauera phenolivorans TaxID=1792543 RepID=A0A7X7LTT7_9RHOO|nr:hypothetical protein [Thauera phenolivorans]NLF53062.1 hypothetical protein [Thauera phenolivorans]
MTWLRALVFLLSCLSVPAAAAEVAVHLFEREGCPHCALAAAELERQVGQGVDVVLRRHEIDGDEAARQRFAALVALFGIERPAVPLVLIGSRGFIGFDDAGGVGAAYAEAIAACRRDGCEDLVAGLAAEGGTEGDVGAATAPVRSRVSLPLFGEVELANLSLPLLTVVLGALDGFNPCAMWVLVFLLGLLLPMQDAARRWILGGAFILASAAVYYGFMAAWLNALLLLGMSQWVRLAVALVALLAGAHYLREWLRNPAMVCEVTAPERRRAVFARLRAAAGQPGLLLALAGIVGLAVAVNLVELLCSAGLPAVYAQMLTMSALPAWQHYAYLALYVFVFMLDDLLVFMIAMTTLRITGASARLTRASRLLGGVLLLAIGLAMLFRPQWLALG